MTRPVSRRRPDRTPPRRRMPARATILRRALAALGLTAAFTLTLSGCLPLAPFVSHDDAESGTDTSSPTGEDVADGLADYYHQVLSWQPCHGDMQCTTVTAPLDWGDPAAQSIELALVRHQAADPQGSLLVNPGGPGASGVDFIANSLHFAVDDELSENFDVVGFDPRGVGQSSSVQCYDDEGMDHYLYTYEQHDFEPGSDAWIDYQENVSRELGEACLKNTGDLLGHVDTTSAARDLDLLRAVLGDDKLNYLGYSYGTYLGATFAELYPDRVGRLVLDGAMDPDTSIVDVSLNQAQGFESALRDYLPSCFSSEQCPFDGDVDGAMSEIGDVLASLDEHPIRADDGRLLDADTMVTAIIFPLYSPQNWPYLTTAFAGVLERDPRMAFVLADTYNDRNAQGHYSDNSNEAFTAINCLDYDFTDDVDVLEQHADEIVAAAPLIGPYMSYGDMGCPGWPVPSKADRGPIAAAGSDPIVVVGTTGDPATPYRWAQSLASELENGHLVTYEGEGHTAYNSSNQCVNDAVDDYFLQGTVPEDDLTC